MNPPAAKADVFIGAHVSTDIASKLTLASMSSSEMSRSSITRAALKQYIERMKPSPCDCMVSHLLAEWHKAQAIPGKSPTFAAHCAKAKIWLTELGIDEPLVKEVHDRLKQSVPK